MAVNEVERARVDTQVFESKWMKITHPYVLAVVVLAIATAAWFVRERHSDVASSPQKSDYETFVERLGGDEPAIRSELSELIRTTSAAVDSSDRAKINGFQEDRLLQIGHVQAFIAKREEPPAFHFVSDEHRRRLQVIAGDQPSAARALAIRKSLAAIADGFALLRQPPDWKVTVEGESPPPMPILELLRDAHQIATGEAPRLRSDPKLPAFATADAELFAALDAFFNHARMQGVFPQSKFPVAFADYHPQIAAAVQAERRILLGDNPHPDSAEAVNDVYRRLEQFLSAIVSFEK
jgi:hypothetical protein